MADEAEVDVDELVAQKERRAAAAPLGPGALASKYGLMPPPSDYKDNMVTKEWATRIPEAAHAKDETGKDETGKGETAAKLSPEDAEERWQRVKDVDSACIEILNKTLSGATSMAEWRDMLLIPEEQEVMKVSCVAFDGMPAAPEETKIGNGMLMLSKAPAEGNGRKQKHRLHFLVDSAKAEMKAEEQWGEVTKNWCCLKSTSHSMYADYTATHAKDMLVATMDIEGNFSHVHSEMVDAATLVSTFGGGSKSRGKSCCSCRSCIVCHFCPKLCCSCRSCIVCHFCPNLEIDCSCCSPTTVGIAGAWRSQTRFEDTIEFYTKTVVQETVKQETCKFPSVQPQQHTMERAAVMSRLHCITFLYRCTATNRIRSCKVVVNPDEKIKDVNKFTLLVSNIVVPGSENQTWSVGATSASVSAAVPGKEATASNSGCDGLEGDGLEEGDCLEIGPATARQGGPFCCS